jgi:hypothetical protein
MELNLRHYSSCGLQPVRRWSCRNGMIQQLTGGGSSHADHVDWD